MADENKIEPTEVAQNTRRAFVRTSAAVAVTAPAVAMLLSASTTPASAQISPYQASSAHILDDFTFGNDHEDIDALKTGTNLNSFGSPSQDDGNFAIIPPA